MGLHGVICVNCGKAFKVEAVDVQHAQAGNLYCQDCQQQNPQLKAICDAIQDDTLAEVPASVREQQTPIDVSSVFGTDGVEPNKKIHLSSKGFDICDLCKLIALLVRRAEVTGDARALESTEVYLGEILAYVGELRSRL